MKSRITRCHNMQMITRLDKIIFHDDDPVVTKDSVWWTISVDGIHIAFAGIKIKDGVGFLTRAGVMEGYRGHGLQSKLIAARVKYAASIGVDVVATYTLTSNPNSSNNLIDQGFKTYTPEHAWAGRIVIYWHRGIT